MIITSEPNIWRYSEKYKKWN